jgi:DNA-binding MarR family transcriptional regulator
MHARLQTEGSGATPKPASAAYSDALQSRIRPWRAILALAYDARGVRRDLFGRNILTDPAWDMLLVLGLAACDGRELTSGELCAGARSSMTTALRVIDYLADRGLLNRRSNPSDRRSVLLSISETGLARMASLLERSAERVRVGQVQPQECATCLI